MTRGPQQQRLRDYLDPANQPTLRGAANQWRLGQQLLQEVSSQLSTMADSMGTSSATEFQGQTADTARASFHRSATAMTAKSEQMGQGGQAFDDSATALDDAVAERDALAQNDGDGPPTRPSTPPGSTDPEDIRAQRDYSTANAAYWDRYQADEQRATDAMTRLDERHTAAGQVFKSIHGEPDPEPSSGDSPGGGGSPTGGGSSPTGHSVTPHTNEATFTPSTPTTQHPIYDNDGRPWTGGTVSDPVPPTGGGDPTPGDPEGPSGPVVATQGGDSTTPSAPSAGGPGAPAAGGGVAAGIGVGVVGGATGGLAGGLAFPGAVTGGTGTGTSGARGIGAAGLRGTGSPVLGRGSNLVGVGNGSGSGATGRGGARSGRTGTLGGRGGPGSRGAMAGTGGTGRSGKDRRRRTDDHELFDDGSDWLDDEDAYDGVID